MDLIKIKKELKEIGIDCHDVIRYDFSPPFIQIAIKNDSLKHSDLHNIYSILKKQFNITIEDMDIEQSCITGHLLNVYYLGNKEEGLDG